MQRIPYVAGLVAALITGLAGGYVLTPAGAQIPGIAWPESAEAYWASLPPDIHHESRSRVPIVDRAGLSPERQAAYDERISPNTTSLAGIYGPGGLRLHAAPEAEIGDGLGGRLKELIRLVVSREMDQVFEWTVHEPVALREGLEPEIIDIIRYDRSLDGVPEREAAMIQLMREFFRDHTVTSETYARVVAAIGVRDMMDMCILMGDYVETAVLLTVNDVHLSWEEPPLLPVP